MSVEHTFSVIRLVVQTSQKILISCFFPRALTCLYTLHLTPYTLHSILRADRTNGSSVAAVVAVPPRVTRIEVQVVRVVWVGSIERTRPIEAVTACIVVRTAAAVACC